MNTILALGYHVRQRLFRRLGARGPRLPRGYLIASGINPRTGQPRTALFRSYRDGQWITFTPIAVINADHITPAQAEDLARLAWKDAS